MTVVPSELLVRLVVARSSTVANVGIHVGGSNRRILYRPLATRGVGP